MYSLPCEMWSTESRDECPPYLRGFRALRRHAGSRQRDHLMLCDEEALKHDAYRLHSTEGDAGAGRQVERIAHGVCRGLQLARAARAGRTLLEPSRLASPGLQRVAAGDAAGSADGLQRNLLGLQGVLLATSPGTHQPGHAGCGAVL